MTDFNTDVIQGTLDMLILKTLSLQPLLGFGRVAPPRHGRCVFRPQTHRDAPFGLAWATHTGRYHER